MAKYINVEKPFLDKFCKFGCKIINQRYSANTSALFNNRQKQVAIQTPKPLTGNRFDYSEDRRPACNSGFKKLAVQWSQEVQFSNGTFVITDSLRLRNRQLLKPANRYRT